MSAVSTPGSGQQPTPSDSNTSSRRFVASGARKTGAAVDITNVDIVFDASPPPVVVGSLPGQQLSTGFKLPLDEKAKAAQVEELSRKQVAEGQDPFLARRLQQQQSSGPQRPWLQGRSHAAQSAAGGRSLVFGGGALSSRQQHAPVAAATPRLVHASAATAAADALVSSGTAAALSETKFERAENFRAAMRQSLAASIAPLWQMLTAPSTMTPLSLSASCEPWDLPFECDSEGGALPQLVTSTAAAAVPSAQRWDWSRCHNLLHHPVVPVHPMMDDERRAQEEASSSGGMKMIKTKEEIRAERRRAAQEKQEAARKDAAAKKAGGVGAAAAHEDQLRWKNLTDPSRVQQMISDPHALHAAIEQQYEERFHKHMRDNYDRHVEALPHQAAKKVSDMWRRAEERPRLQVYHVPKARNVHCVNRLRNFANDDKLRGFLLWVGEEELLAVLAGGEVAMRHMDRWMVEKMEWHRPGRLEAGVRGDPTPVLNMRGGGDEEQSGEDVHAAASKRVRESVTTNAAGRHGGDGDELLHAAKLRRVDPSLLERTTGRLVLSLPLLRVGDVSFLLPRKPLDVMRAQRRTSQVDEAVFVRHCDTVEAGLRFVRDELPAGGVVPSVMFAWRQAFDV